MAASGVRGVRAGAMTYAPPRRRTQISLRATGRPRAYSIIAVAALGLLIPSTAAADPLASASWHGRAIQAPHEQTPAATTPASLPVGWSAGPVRFGTGFHHPGGSERVREVQQRLWRLGYQPGPIDGLFGPQTRAAVEWFQIKHGLAPDGVVGPHTLGVLRERRSAPAPAARIVPAEPVPGERAAARGRSPQPQPAAQAAHRGQKPAGEHGSAIAPGEVVAIALLLLAAPAALVFAARQRRRSTNGTKTPKTRRPVVDREAAAGPAPQVPATASPEGVPAIGYMRSTRDRAELARHAGAIKRECTSRGWALAELVRDDQGARRPFERPGLASAMNRLAEPGTSRLVVSKLAHLSRSATELTALFEWCARNDVQVVATDVGIDTTTPEGQVAAKAVLVAVAKRQASAARQNGRSGTNRNGRVKVKAAATSVESNGGSG
jgi:peptidoglycan hydrolase-like protein with peptidoglycan-binding domain